MKRRGVLCLVLISITALALVALPAAAQNCSNVSYRLWTKGGETWHRLGERVEIESGTEGHIYLHVDSKSKSPYSTRADIGYPNEFGIAGTRSTEVVRHVRMKAQTGDDRSHGRIRFDAMEPGSTRLGFRLMGVGVRSPGGLDLVRPACRTGAIPIRVVAKGGGHHDHGGETEEPVSEAERAAEELVSRLYRGLLRRPDSGRLDEGFVSDVRRGGRQGLLEVAATMVSSSEFRRDALRRTEEAHGRNNLDELRHQLLADIYRDLYGYAEPDAQGRRDDLYDLEDCLSSSRGGDEACTRLGREIVSRQHFYDHNQELIDALATPRRRGRR